MPRKNQVTAQDVMTAAREASARMAAAKPEITLRNVKYAAFASEETSCFEATVYVDGRKFCAVSNDGHGGCNFYTPIKGGTMADLDAARLEIGRRINPQLVERYEGKQALVESKTVEELEDEYSGRYWETGVRYLEEFWDGLVGALLADALYEKDLRRAFGREVLFLKPGARGVFQIKHRHRVAEVSAHIAKKYPGATILNGLPMAEAVRLFREQAEGAQ